MKAFVACIILITLLMSLLLVFVTGTHSGTAAALIGIVGTLAIVYIVEKLEE